MMHISQLPAWAEAEFAKIRAELPGAMLVSRDLGHQWWVGVEWSEGVERRRAAMELCRAWPSGKYETTSAEDIIAEARRRMAAVEP